MLMFNTLEELKNEEYYWWKDRKKLFPVKLIILSQNICVQG